MRNLREQLFRLDRNDKAPMDLNKEVIQQFERYPQLRVLFFFDSTQSYGFDISTWADKDILCIPVTGQYFTLKYQLETELKNKKVFLYFNRPEPNAQELEEFPLVDLLIANKQLHVDPVMAFIEENKLPGNARKIVEKYYQGELRHKGRRDFLASVLSPMEFSEKALRKGLLCYHLGLKRISDFNIITAQVFVLALTQNDFETTIDKLKKLDLLEMLESIMKEVFGDALKEINFAGIKDLANRFKYNLILRTEARALPEDQYNRLKEDNPIRLSRINSLLNDWEADSQVNPYLGNVIEELSANIKEEKIIEWYGSEKTFGYYTSKLKQQLLEECLKQYETQPAKVKQIIKPWFENEEADGELQTVIQFLWYASSMFEVRNLYTNFTFDNPAEYIHRYERELYQVDLCYRKANDAFGAWQKQTGRINLDKHIRSLHEAYEAEFITPFNNEWMKCLKAFKFNLNEIPIAKQYNFYREKVTTKQQKTAVIISDAFRYEAARELVDQLTRDSKNVTKIDVMLASIPSVTSLGMANLLPNKGLKVSGNGFVIEGISTEGTANRAKILQLTNPKTGAIDFKNIIAFDQDQGRDYFKQNDVAYVYHNKIDGRGEAAKTEKSTFDAVQETLDDIKTLVRKLNSWNVYRILITADHGFLQSMRDIPETMKENVPNVTEEFKVKNRVVMGKDIKGAAYTLNITDTTNIKESIPIGLPKSVNRYRIQAAGVQYVHGGASIQELIVPVIEYSRMREETSEKVKVKLLKFDDKITSGYMRLNVLQLEPVASGMKELEATVGLYNDKDETVSNEQITLFNSSSTVATERNTQIVLTLSAKGSQLSSCMLKAFDKEDEQRLNPLFSQLILIQTLIQRDEF